MVDLGQLKDGWPEDEEVDDFVEALSLRVGF